VEPHFLEECMGTRVESPGCKFHDGKAQLPSQSYGLLDQRFTNSFSLCFRSDRDLVHQEISHRKYKWVICTLDHFAQNIADGLSVFLSNENPDQRVCKHRIKESDGIIIILRHFENMGVILSVEALYIRR